MGGKVTITTVAGQAALPARNAVHWHILHAGQHLGLRKTKTAQTWYARAYDGKRQVRHALGAFNYLPANERFSAASKEAEQWFKHLDAGGLTRGITVLEACKRYIQALRDDPEKGDVSADSEAGFVRRFIAQDNIASIPLGKLVKAHVADWRKRMESKPTTNPQRGKHCRSRAPQPPPRERSPSSVNRNMVALRAALNLAKADGFVTSDLAWASALRPIKHADKSRDVYLDRQQRQALIAALPADVAAFTIGLCVLPLRPGALAGLRVGDFDISTGTIKIGKDKSGKDRRILLPPKTTAILKQQARSKLPGAPLFSRVDGEAWDRHAWRKPIKVAVRATGLPENITAYALRHSTITDLIADGVPALTVAQLSGTSIAMIERHYGHLVQYQAAAALERLVL